MAVIDVALGIALGILAGIKRTDWLLQIVPGLAGGLAGGVAGGLGALWPQRSPASARAPAGDAGSKGQEPARPNHLAVTIHQTHMRAWLGRDHISAIRSGAAGR